MDEVKPTTLWQHYNGTTYIVLIIANKESTKPEYPVTVVYQNYSTGSIWSRPLNDWHRSFTRVIE